MERKSTEVTEKTEPEPQQERIQDMQNHEENPVRITRIRTQEVRTPYGTQWAEGYRVTWTDPASGTSLARLVADKKSALRLKRELQGKPITA